MVEQLDVGFRVEGNVTLRGWLFVPDGRGPRPAITMAHGFAGIREHGLDRFARVFAEAGFVVLVHDHRGFGFSDGQPRFDVDPWRQIADWRFAISYLQSHHAVDPDRIGLWGTDTDNTTVLHVPSIGLVVAGDAAYNGVHQYLLESRGDGIDAWLAAIDIVEALRPRAVVAGHKNRALPDNPAILGQTRQYLIDAQRLLDEKPRPRESFDRMLALYPDRLNPGPVWYGALGLLS
jgi:fermentation-respiration switch protein FrsA (DUF1100 family)